MRAQACNREASVARLRRPISHDGSPRLDRSPLASTQFGFAFPSDDWDSFPAPVEMRPGDGTVDERSARRPCEAWGARTRALQLGGVDHVGMLQSKRVIDMVVEWATQDAVGYDDDGR